MHPGIQSAPVTESVLEIQDENDISPILQEPRLAGDSDDEQVL